ncbi:MAG: protoporphyrinogen oxidase [Propionibacteriaceae bacterium]|nr:protoporphyrinogen oxidase [Propionibacteriaceae bacterium]
MTKIVVVGAGFAGLVTARKLAEQGHQVTVLEASDRLGGQVNTVNWHGLPVDVGAEAMFLGGPQLGALVRELSLSDQLVAPSAGTSWLQSGKRLVPLPAGVGPTGPGKLAPVLKSGLLSPFALARAGLEPLMARRKIDGDISVGDFVTRRFGRAVADTFVDPMLGNLHAGDIDRLSLVSTAPQLVPAAREGRSLVRRKTPAPASSGPGTSATKLPPFASFATGLSTLITTLAAGLAIHTNSPVRGLRRTADGWDVTTDTGTITAERLILTIPAARAAALLEPTLPGITGDLTAGRVADVATVVFAYPAAAAHVPALRDGNGILLRSGSGRILKAATFLSRKWAHLRSDDVFLVRASAGRAGSDVLEFVDDDTLARRLHRELADLINLNHRPVDTLVMRWPGTYPQLEVGHAARMAAIRQRLADHPVQLVGTAVDGIGLPSALRSALAAVG